MLLMIDNYDSFTYNLVQYLGELGENIKVFRNDRITVEKISSLSPDRIVISPGPGMPESAGISRKVVKAFAGKIPILGVCLGHQCIGEAFGGRIVPARKLMHGKTSMIYHDGKNVFRGLPNPFEATRYHSLVIDKRSLPGNLEISAWTKDGEIMGVRLKDKTCQLVNVSDFQSAKRTADNARSTTPFRQSFRGQASDAKRTTCDMRRSTCIVEGVQFHPESILTAEGKRLLENFLNISKGK